MARFGERRRCRRRRQAQQLRLPIKKPSPSQRGGCYLRISSSGGGGRLKLALRNGPSISVRLSDPKARFDPKKTNMLPKYSADGNSELVARRPRPGNPEGKKEAEALPAADKGGRA